MMKKKFLSVYKMYVIRKRGCSQKSAESYVSYLKGVNSRSMRELKYPDYLEWISECSDYKRIHEYICELERSVPFVSSSTESKGTLLSNSHMYSCIRL